MCPETSRLLLASVGACWYQATPGWFAHVLCQELWRMSTQWGWMNGADEMSGLGDAPLSSGKGRVVSVGRCCYLRCACFKKATNVMLRERAAPMAKVVWGVSQGPTRACASEPIMTASEMADLRMPMACP